LPGSGLHELKVAAVPVLEFVLGLRTAEVRQLNWKPRPVRKV
jgi:hypothetical protein